jgi:hypothetical protein
LKYVADFLPGKTSLRQPAVLETNSHKNNDAPTPDHVIEMNEHDFQRYFACLRFASA